MYVFVDKFAHETDWLTEWLSSCRLRDGPESYECINFPTQTYVRYKVTEFMPHFDGILMSFLRLKLVEWHTLKSAKEWERERE